MWSRRESISSQSASYWSSSSYVIDSFVFIIAVNVLLDN